MVRTLVSFGIQREGLDECLMEAAHDVDAELVKTLLDLGATVQPAMWDDILRMRPLTPKGEARLSAVVDILCQCPSNITLGQARSAVTSRRGFVLCRLLEKRQGKADFDPQEIIPDIGCNIVTLAKSEAKAAYLFRDIIDTKRTYKTMKDIGWKNNSTWNYKIRLA